MKCGLRALRGARAEGAVVLECPRKHLGDPGRLGRCVALAVVGVASARGALDRLVLARDFRMRAKVVAEGDHALDLGVAGGEAVELDATLAGRRVIEDAVA